MALEIWFYIALTVIATILGGFLPLYTKLKNIPLRYLVAFAAGLLISVAFLELLPEANGNFMWILIGFFSLYIIEKSLMIHECHNHECEQHTIGWTSLIGIALESLIDGAAIILGYTIEPALGIIIAIAVLVHEIPRGFSTTVIMKNAGYKSKAVYGALAIDGGFTIVGALLARFLPLNLFGPLIAIAAGTFIYIGAADLLPEAHKKFNVKVIMSVLVGVIIVILLSFI